MLSESEAGRFGPVYRAEDEATGRPVTVKVFDQGLTPEQNAALSDALLRLCQTPLDHPSIVPLVSAGVEGDVAYLVEGDLEGTPLDRVMRRDGPAPLADILLPITRVAGALDFAAAMGVYHGALHPREILVTANTMFLAGLGVVQALSDAGLDVPVSGAYASPQQAGGLSPAKADDIYALAAIVFELVYGRPVKDRDALASAVTPLTGLDHRRLRDVLEGSMADDPKDRPGSAMEFAAALQKVLVDTGIPPVTVAGDLPLRGDDRASGIELESESEYVTESRIRESEFRMFESQSGIGESESGVRGWVGLAATLAIGLLVGFVGGFVVGQWSELPPAPVVERPVARADRPAGSPEAAAGRDFTESEVPARPVKPLAAGAGQDPEPRSESMEPESSRLKPAPTTEESANRRFSASGVGASQSNVGAGLSRLGGEGILHVVSRPAGAQVFVDGRLMGKTPLSLPQVRAGAHAVRLQLPGYQRWSTSVKVDPGARARVAASLER